MKIPIKAILVVIATTFWTSAFSQLVLNKNGQLAIFPLKNTPVASFPTSNLLADTTASIIVLGNKIYYGGGKIAFGMKSEGEASIGSKSFGLLQLVGDRGMEYCSAGSKLFSISSTIRDTRATFACGVFGDSFNTRSDIRLKGNVSSIGETWKALSDLNAISYNLKTNASMLEANKSNSEDHTKDNRRYFGFSAQEVKEIFPELVSEDENGYLSINYDGFIPLLVEAYKNLEKKNQELESKINALTNPKKISAYNQDIEIEMVPAMSQNYPNPFANTSKIEITLPSNISTASIQIYDINGSLVKTIPIEERGKIELSIDASNLIEGIYLYALAIDGEEVLTRRMLISK